MGETEWMYGLMMEAGGTAVNACWQEQWQLKAHGGRSKSSERVHF